MKVKNLKETLVGYELFEKIGFEMDNDSDYFVALNYGNIIIVESDGATTQYNCDGFSDNEKEELLQDILNGDCVETSINELEEKYRIDIYYYYSFGEWLSDCGGADFY